MTTLIFATGLYIYTSTLTIGEVSIGHAGRRWLDGLTGESQHGSPIEANRWIFIAAILLIVLREPDLLIHPRFWAEDGAHFFEYAFHHDWLETLLFHPDYRLLLSNLAAIAGNMVPIEYAPLPFALIWLVIICTAVGIVAFGQSHLWNTPAKKIVICAAIVFAPSSEEIWLNGNGTQYYCALTTLLILCETKPFDNRERRYFFRVLLLASSLNGVLSCLLAPLFGIKAWRTRPNRESMVQLAVLAAGVTIQLVAIVEVTDTTTKRAILSEVSTFGWMAAIKSLSLPFSIDVAQEVFRFNQHHLKYGSEGYFYAGMLFSAAWIGLLAAFAARLWKGDGIYLVAGLAMIFVFSCVFGIAAGSKRALLIPLNANRYFFVPSALALMTVAVSIAPLRRTWSRETWSIVTGLVLVLGLTNGIHRFYEAELSKPGWPDWRQEISVWRSEPRYVPHIWPPRWFIDLRPPTAESPN